MMGGKQSVYIVEDQNLVRAGLRALLAQEGDLEVIGEASNGRDAVQAIGTLTPDLVLMDLTMPGMNGIEAMHAIKRRNPEIRMVVLTIHRTDEYIHESLRAGADGYILKDGTHDELLLAIRSVLGGKTYLSPDVSDQVIHGFLGTGKTAGSNGGWESLTLREREVLKLIAEGHPNKYIAKYLCLSIKTVETHRSNLMKKLNLHNASMLTSYAIGKGLVGV